MSTTNTLKTIAIPDNTAFNCIVSISGVNEGGGNVLNTAYIVSGLAEGSISISSITTLSFWTNDTSGDMDVTFTSSSLNLLVNVTQSTGVNWYWSCNVQMIGSRDRNPSIS